MRGMPREIYRHPLWFILTVGVFLAAGVLWFRGSESSKALRFPLQEPGKLRQALRSAVKQAGAEASYLALKQQVENLPEDARHLPLHLFGEVLYALDGVEGIAICDAAYGFGCFHGVFTRAVGEKGLEVLGQLDGACVARFGVQGVGCSHGIGHGLGELLGPAQLTQQLDLCDTLSWKGVLHGCRGGVFMEYHNPTVADQEKLVTKTRVFDAKEPYGSCRTVPEKYQPACIYELPAWWWDSGVTNPHQLAALCAGLAPKSGEEYCFIGMGYVLATRSGYQQAAVFDGCASIAPAPALLWCRAGGAWGFFADPKHRGQSDSLCAGLAKEGEKKCQEISRQMALSG